MEADLRRIRIGDLLELRFVAHLCGFAFDDQVKPFTGNNDDAVRIVREILAFASSGTCHKVEGAIHPDRPRWHDVRPAIGTQG